MKEEMLTRYLSKNEFHLDAHGRIIVEDNEILNAINGAMLGAPDMDGTRSNGACYNSGCK